MDDIGSILKIVGVLVLLFYVIRRLASSKRRRVDLSESVQRATAILYADMRAHALATTPQMLGINVPEDVRTVYGVVIDWSIGNSVATIVAFANGDAGLYLNIPGGIIGGEMPEAVQEAARQLVSQAQTMFDLTVDRAEAPVATTNEVRFSLITNRGIRIAAEPTPNIEGRTSPWNPLFDRSNELLATIRASRKGKRSNAKKMRSGKKD